MIKKKLIFIIFILAAGCGFKPILYEVNEKSINIKQINYDGNNELQYLIKSNLDLKTKPSSKGLILNLSAFENLNYVTKNISGINTERLISITIKMNVRDHNNLRDLITDTFISTARYTLSDNLENDEATKNILRSKLIENLVQKVKFRLLILLKQNEL